MSRITLSLSRPRGPASDLHRTHNDRLVNDLPPAAQAGFRATDVGLVDLHPVPEQLSIGSDHRAPQLVQHGPSRLVPAQSQLPLQLQSGEARRLSRDQVGGPEPLRQWQPGSMEDRPRSHGGVVPAPSAPPQQPRRQLERIVMLASGTAETLRPAAAREVLAAGALVSKELPKLVQRPRILRAHRARRYPLGSVGSTG
jgi:hypothetical protein